MMLGWSSEPDICRDLATSGERILQVSSSISDQAMHGVTAVGHRLTLVTEGALGVWECGGINTVLLIIHM